MPSKALSEYLSYYKGSNDWHLKAFRLINDNFLPKRVLYPGSWIHITPSLVFSHVLYVDLFSKMETIFTDSELLEYVENHKEYQDKPKIEFHQSDYRSNFSEVEASFDLLISLSSGFISQACGLYLKTGGLLFVDNEHYDASMAYVDPKFDLVGVFKTVGQYVESKRCIQSYFITTKGGPITLEMVKDNSQRSPSKARYKLKRKATFYIFKRQ
jgi:hypothetical protein